MEQLYTPKFLIVWLASNILEEGAAQEGRGTLPEGDNSPKLKIDLGLVYHRGQHCFKKLLPLALERGNRYFRTQTHIKSIKIRK